MKLFNFSNIMKEQIRIENKGKISKNRYELTEELIQKIVYGLGENSLIKFCPKMYNICTLDNLTEEESIGFYFTLLFDIFKGKVYIKKQKNKQLYNLDFYRRFPTKEKFTYSLTKQIKDIHLQDIVRQFNFIIVGENQNIKTGNIYLLKSGLVGIIRKYYSNIHIGISYDEYNPDIEDFIGVEDIEALIREGEKL